MALIKFTLTDDHLKLIDNLNWDFDLFAKEGDTPVLPSLVEGKPFGEGHVYAQMQLILDGPRVIIDPNDTISFILDDEIQARYDKLLVELPMALQIVLTTRTFIAGNYSTKSHFIQWIKVS